MYSDIKMLLSGISVIPAKTLNKKSRTEVQK